MTQKIRIDINEKYIFKPEGERTPASKIPFSDLQKYLNIFSKEINTHDASEAYKLWQTEGMKEEAIPHLLKTIIVSFGEGYRIWGRFADYYVENAKEINTHMIAAHNAPDANSALEEIRNINVLGESYASKVLRFINSNYVVLDSILRDEMCGNIEYQEFTDICSEIGNAINITPVEVESALFAFVQIANPNQRRLRWRQHQS